MKTVQPPLVFSVFDLFFEAVDSSRYVAHLVWATVEEEDSSQYHGCVSSEIREARNHFPYVQDWGIHDDCDGCARYHDVLHPIEGRYGWNSLFETTATIRK